MKASRISSKKMYPIYLAFPALIIYTVFIILPFAASLGLSFTDWNIRRMYTLMFRGVDNYIAIFQDEVFLKALGNTLLFASSTTILKIIAGMCLALMLEKTNRLNSVLRTVFYLPCVLSPLAIGIVFRSILGYEGLINNTLDWIGLNVWVKDWLASYSTAMSAIILVETWMWSGFTMFLFIAGMQAIPKDYYEYAATEGIGKYHQFRHITLPLLVPAFTVIMTLSLTGGLKVFDIIYVMTGGGPGFDTQVVSTYVQRSFSTGLLGQSCAASVVLAMLVVVLTFFINRYLSKREVEM